MTQGLSRALKGAITDPNNSRTTVIAPNTTALIGSSTNIDLYDGITVNIAGTPEVCQGTLIFEFSPDNSNWDTSVPVPVNDLNVVIPFPLRAVLGFFRLRYANLGTTQTALRVTTRLHYDFPGDLIRTPTQVIGPGDPVEAVRALVEPGFGYGQRRILGADRSVFGDAIAMPRINQGQADFSQAIANNDVTATTTGVGTPAPTQAAGEAVISTGAGVVAATNRLQSNRTLRYTPFREVFCGFTARFTTPSATAGEHQRVGIYDDNNGFFLGYQGNVFGFTARKAGVDTFTSLANAVGDPLNATFLSRFARTVNGLPRLEAFDATKKGVWRIRFGWLGSSVIHFELQAPTGEWMTVHTIEQPNLSAAPSIESPNLPWRVEVIKAALDATNLTIGIGSMAFGVVQDPYGLEPYDVKSREEVQANATLTGIALTGVGVNLFTVPTGRRFRLTDLDVSLDSNQNTACELQLRDATTFNGGTLIWRGQIGGTGADSQWNRSYKSPPGFTTQVEFAYSATHAGTLAVVNISGYTEPI